MGNPQKHHIGQIAIASLAAIFMSVSAPAYADPANNKPVQSPSKVEQSQSVFLRSAMDIAEKTKDGSGASEDLPENCIVSENEDGSKSVIACPPAPLPQSKAE